MKFLPDTYNFLWYTNEQALSILKGLGTTLLIACAGVLLGLMIGIIISFIKVGSKSKILNGICTVYVAIFRGTPIVVQLLVFYFLIFYGVRINEVFIAILVFGLNSGAYLSESIRAGIDAVDKGQMEASRSLGLNYKQSMIKVILPQAIKNILPAIGNEFIALIKETSVVGFIAVNDLTKVFQGIGANSYNLFAVYLPLAVIYFILIFIFVQILSRFEKRLKKSDRN